MGTVGLRGNMHESLFVNQGFIQLTFQPLRTGVKIRYHTFVGMLQE